MNGEKEPNFVTIHHAFAATEHGQKLASQTRWWKFQDMTPLDNEEWVNLLGVDANNLNHLRLTHGLTRVFIRYMDMYQPGELSQEDKDTLEVAALIHDWAESITGDINWNDKTAEDTEREREVFISNLSAFVPEDDLRTVGSTFENALHQVIFNPATRLGTMFNAIELVGYVRTALRAHEHVAANTDPRATLALQSLVANVLGTQITTLSTKHNNLPPVLHYLKMQEQTITNAFRSAAEYE